MVEQQEGELSTLEQAILRSHEADGRIVQEYVANEVLDRLEALERLADGGYVQFVSEYMGRSRWEIPHIIYQLTDKGQEILKKF